MSDANERPETGKSNEGERWTISDGNQLQEAFDLLRIPPLAGYTPAAITAVGVSVSPTGEVAHYPVYAQVVEAELSEPTEVRAAIVILQRWLQMQKRRKRGVGAR